MKKIFKILPFFILVAFISSCEDNEGAVHHEDISKFTLLSFDQSAYRLNVIIDSVGTLTVPFRASALSSVDRTYNIEFIEDGSIADPLTYNLPSTVTIPANEYSGDLVITGQDLGLVDLTPKPFVFKVTGLGESEFIDDDTITINVVEVCPLYSDFTGNYILTPISSGGFGVPFASGSVVTLTAVSEFERQFTANYLPEAISGYTINFRFSLSCSEVVASNYTTSLYCQEGGPNIAIISGDVYGAYNPEDDSEIIVSYTEEYGSCGGSPTVVTFRLVKQ